MGSQMGLSCKNSKQRRRSYDCIALSVVVKYKKRTEDSMSNQKNMTVNQHYISQGLIKLFSENKKYVFEYNVQTGMTYRAAIRKTMSGKKIYEHSSLPENTLEKFFKTIEDDYIPAIKSVVVLLDNSRIEDARNVIKSLLPSFLLFYYRSGAILYELGYQNSLMQ